MAGSITIEGTRVRRLMSRYALAATGGRRLVSRYALAATGGSRLMSRYALAATGGVHAPRAGGRSPYGGTMDQPEPLLLLALCHVGSLRPRERLRVAELLRSAEALGRLSARDLEGIVGRRMRLDGYSARETLMRAEADERSLTRNGIGCIFYSDPGYPPLLRGIYDPPVVLFYRGRPPRAGGGVAVVGTRRPTAASRAAAKELGATLASAGVTVVSGLARGIDGEAHRGAVEAGGQHVAVLGCGLCRILPACNAGLGRRLLARGGTLLSEQPPDEPPRKQHFPARNRIISGLSQVVVIVQAPSGSGALITAEFALEQGREVLVHADGLPGASGAGGEELASSGARVVSGGAEVLREIGIEPPPGATCAEEGGSVAVGVGKRIAQALERELEGQEYQEMTRSNQQWR